MTRQDRLDNPRAKPAQSEQLGKLFAAASFATGQLVDTEFGVGENKLPRGLRLSQQRD